VPGCAGHIVTIEVVPRELPRAVAGFINRDRELRQIDSIAVIAAPEGACPVVVLGGTAGVGKTALGLRWAHRAAGRYPDGQLYVNLRGFDDREPLTPAYALGSLLRSLGVEPARIPMESEERAALYQSLMSGARRIVFLDNVVSAGQIRLLLPASAGCVVMVTTRGELRGLSRLEGAHKVRLDVLPEGEAVALLQQVAAEREVADDPAELAELARLCGLLPLALRIAGDRLASRPFAPVSEFVAAVRDESARLDSLSDAVGEVTVRAVFAWSYRELPETAALLFRRLGAHPGEWFTVPAGVALSGLPQSQVQFGFEALVSAHLLEQLDARRYAFHDLLRAYAIDLSRTQDGESQLREVTLRLAAWYVQSVSEAGAAMGTDSLGLAAGAGTARPSGGTTFAGFAPARGWFEMERANAVAAVLAAAKLGADETAWRLAAALLGIFEVNNTFDDWFTVSQCGLESARRCGDEYAQGIMLESLGKAYRQSHQLKLAEQYQHQALEIREAIGDGTGVIRSVNALGLICRRARRYDEARDHFARAAGLSRAASDRTMLAFALMNVGGLDTETGAFEAARGELLEALTLLGETGQPVYEINALQDLGVAQRGLGAAQDALATINRAVQLASRLNNDVFLAEALLELARTQCALADPAQALLHYAEVAAVQKRLGDRGREAVALDEIGTTYREIGQPGRAIEYHAAAVEIFRSLGDTLGEQRAAAHRDEAEEAMRHQRDPDPHA
jgi:tetratricopeptide (TPR) repeat protein